jgi:NADH dehydrogenase FAD-containing subunit
VCTSDALENRYAQLRGMVIPGWEEASRIPLDKLLKKGKIETGIVTSVADGVVTLSDGRTLTGDCIVLAHGGGPCTLPGGTPADIHDSKSFKAKLVEKQAEIKGSQRIVVIGGGPIGVELAAEIKSFYPDKSVTLVHRSAQLLNNASPPIIEKAALKVADRMRDMGIELKLGVTVNDSPVVENGDGFVHATKTLQLSDNTSLETDLTIVCVGGAKREGNLVSAVDPNNRVIVNEFLQVHGMENVYCVGDANNVNETKLGYFAGLQAAVAADNIKRSFSEKKLTPYVPANGDAKYGIMFVPLGPTRGVAAFGEKVMGDRLTSLIKSKGLFTQKTFQGVNAIPVTFNNTPNA